MDNPKCFSSVLPRDGRSVNSPRVTIPGGPGSIANRNQARIYSISDTHHDARVIPFPSKRETRFLTSSDFPPPFTVYERTFEHEITIFTPAPQPAREAAVTLSPSWPRSPFVPTNHNAGNAPGITGVLPTHQQKKSIAPSVNGVEEVSIVQPVSLRQGRGARLSFLGGRKKDHQAKQQQQLQQLQQQQGAAAGQQHAPLPPPPVIVPPPMMANGDSAGGSSPMKQYDDESGGNTPTSGSHSHSHRSRSKDPSGNRRSFFRGLTDATSKHHANTNNHNDANGGAGANDHGHEWMADGGNRSTMATGMSGHYSQTTGPGGTLVQQPTLTTHREGTGPGSEAYSGSESGHSPLREKEKALMNDGHHHHGGEKMLSVRKRLSLLRLGKKSSKGNGLMGSLDEE